jgi:CheY-like chemotaxis protein
MSDSDIKDEAPKQLGRIALKRRPAAVVTRPREPVARHAELVALSEKYGVPALDLDQVCLKLSDLGNVPRSLAQHHTLVPVLARSDRLFVAMKDPSQLEVIQEVEFVSGKRVYAYAAPPEDIAEIIERAYLAKERGAEHFIAPSCPPETLRKAGLLPAIPPSERMQLFPPAPDPLLREDATSAVELRLASESPTYGQPGPPATVSAYPPRLSSLPPALRSKAAEAGDDADELISALEDAFDDLLDEASSVCHPPGTQALEPAGAVVCRTILIVDDEEESRALLERVLIAEGYQVRTTTNGRQALRMIKERAPDLLLLAALLPEVHGFEIAQRLRGSQRYGSMPIVMISAVHRGWRLAEDLRDSCGVEHYIERPLRPDDIKRTVLLALAEPPVPAQVSVDLSERAEQALADGMAAYRGGDVAQAIVHLERGVAIDPLAYRLHFHLGLLFAQQGQTYDAIRALERAVEINSRHFAGVKNLAIMYCQAGFRNRAVELWTRGLQLAPDEETRAAIQEHLAALLSQEGLS